MNLDDDFITKAKEIRESMNNGIHNNVSSSQSLYSSYTSDKSYNSNNTLFKFNSQWIPSAHLCVKKNNTKW